MKTFNDLRTIDVSENIKKKGKLSYISWPIAVDTLLQNDPTAWWEFQEPVYFNETLMVRCSVHALGKTMHMHLPVMDHKNSAIANPDARKVSDAMMRCLTKCIACFGIGLHIYAGEDFPFDDEPVSQEPMDVSTFIQDIQDAPDLDQLKIRYFEAVKKANGNKSAMTALEVAKDARKAALS